MTDTNQPDCETVVQLDGVSRRFGATTALSDVSLNVPRGTVLGLVGVNGAGKTTLIKHVLGLLRPQTGQVRVFGLDPVADPVGVLSKIGYLSEEKDLPDWMRVDELLHYSQAFYSSWDDQYAEELRQTFELDPAKRIKQLSRGQRARGCGEGDRGLLGGWHGPRPPRHGFGGRSAGHSRCRRQRYRPDVSEIRIGAPEAPEAPERQVP